MFVFSAQPSSQRQVPSSTSEESNLSNKSADLFVSMKQTNRQTVCIQDE